MKIVVIGKLYKENLTNGPGGVLNNLRKGFDEQKTDVRYIFLNEHCSKFNTVKKILKEVLFSRSRVINVHTDGFLLVYLVYIISLINSTHKYFLTVHGVYCKECEISGKYNRKYLFLERRLYKKFDNLICVSEKVKMDIKSIYGREKKIDVIHNGVSKELLSEPTEKNLIGDTIELISVGGINKLKGIMECLSIVNCLVNDLNKNVKLSVYGKIQDDEIYSKYNDYIKKFNLENNIFYYGMITDKNELMEKYKSSHLHLCMSLYDTFNVSILESMSVGCPCIISDQCGAIDIIEQTQDGFIVNIYDKLETSVKKILISLERDEYIYKNMQTKAYYTARRNTWDDVVRKYIYIFSES